MSGAPRDDTDIGALSGVLQDGTAPTQPVGGNPNLDTIRALCHDLRQPLAAILLLAGAESGDARGRLGMIFDQAQWLSDMVEGVISDAADDQPRPVDVVTLAARCVRLAQSTALCQIEFSGTDRAMAVAAPIALSRAVGCVLDNAVRASGESGQVTVGVTCTDDVVTVRVIDDGPGLGHVTSNNSLGLTITRALVSACGGTFELKAGVGGGMVAQIGLPAIRKRSNDTMRLLVCDDEAVLVDALSRALTENGHTVVATASDPDEAVEAARKFQPDACLLDVNFPGASGLDAIGRIHEVSPNTKVVMLSGSFSKTLLAAAIAEGAQGFVDKGKPIEVIIEALQTARWRRRADDLPRTSGSGSPVGTWPPTATGTGR